MKLKTNIFFTLGVLLLGLSAHGEETAQLNFITNASAQGGKSVPRSMVAGIDPFDVPAMRIICSQAFGLENTNSKYDYIVPNEVHRGEFGTCVIAYAGKATCCKVIKGGPNGTLCNGEDPYNQYRLEDFTWVDHIRLYYEAGNRVPRLANVCCGERDGQNPPYCPPWEDTWMSDPEF